MLLPARVVSDADAALYVTLISGADAISGYARGEGAAKVLPAHMITRAREEV